MLEIVTAEPPVFVTVTVCAALLVLIVWFPNARLVGLTCTTCTMPVPESGTVWVPALSAMVSVLVRAPVPPGANCTLTVQLAPAPKLDPQVVVSG
jgi:hypothetical protein